MLIEDKVIGIVSIQSPHKNAYTQYHFDILSALSTYVAVAIDNANAYKLLEQKVTERTKDLKKAYEDLLITNTNFDKFTYRSAHDLRGPLARMLGLCHLAKLETKDKKGLEYLVILENVAFEMDHMLSRLLRTHQNKKRSIHKSEISVVQGIQSILKSIRRKNEIDWIDIKLDVNKDLVFKTDKYLFEILVQNVITNAFQFQDDSKQHNYVEIKAWSMDNNKQLKINIKDNGIGIQRKLQHKIFDMFSVASDITKGSGLGLYEAKVIVNKLKGKVELVHSDRDYTEFEITL